MSLAEVMDLSPVVDILETDDGSSSIVITRRAAGTFTNGLYVAGTTSTVYAQANIQPASIRDLETLPEGQRNKETIAIYSKVELYPAVENSIQGDLVTHSSKTYEVKQVRDWLETAGVFKSLAVKVDLA